MINFTFNTPSFRLEIFIRSNISLSKLAEERLKYLIHLEWIKQAYGLPNQYKYLINEGDLDYIPF